jgi:hypothetical protein
VHSGNPLHCFLTTRLNRSVLMDGKVTVVRAGLVDS